MYSIIVSTTLSEGVFSIYQYTSEKHCFRLCLHNPGLFKRWGQSRVNNFSGPTLSVFMNLKLSYQKSTNILCNPFSRSNRHVDFLICFLDHPENYLITIGSVKMNQIPARNQRGNKQLYCESFYMSQFEVRSYLQLKKAVLFRV